MTKHSLTLGRVKIPLLGRYILEKLFFNSNNLLKDTQSFRSPFGSLKSVMTFAVIRSLVLIVRLFYRNESTTQGVSLNWEGKDKAVLPRNATLIIIKRWSSTSSGLWKLLNSVNRWFTSGLNYELWLIIAPFAAPVSVKIGFSTWLIFSPPSQSTKSACRSYLEKTKSV